MKRDVKQAYRVFKRVKRFLAFANQLNVFLGFIFARDGTTIISILDVMLVLNQPLLHILML
jgi:hypothetical protein